MRTQPTGPSVCHTRRTKSNPSERRLQSGKIEHLSVRSGRGDAGTSTTKRSNNFGQVQEQRLEPLTTSGDDLCLAEALLCPFAGEGSANHVVLSARLKDQKQVRT